MVYRRRCDRAEACQRSSVACRAKRMRHSVGVQPSARGEAVPTSADPAGSHTVGQGVPGSWVARCRSGMLYIAEVVVGAACASLVMFCNGSLGCRCVHVDSSADACRLLCNVTLTRSDCVACVMSSRRAV